MPRFSLHTMGLLYTARHGAQFSTTGLGMTTEPMKPSTTTRETPTCPRCRSAMHLERIEPAEPQHDRRIFRCRDCGESVSETVKYR